MARRLPPSQPDNLPPLIPAKYVELTEEEAWAIDHVIRHTYPPDGLSPNVGQALLLKVMHLVLEFEERRGQPFAPVQLPIALTEDECWAIDHQVRLDLALNGKPVGRTLLLKVFRLLTEFANERDSQRGMLHLGGLADQLRQQPDTAPPEGDPPGGCTDPRSTSGDEGPQNHPPGRPSPPSRR